MTVSQAHFCDALLDPEQPVPDGLTDGNGRPTTRRFNVYRNNVVVSLTDALATGFPVITRVLGRENINGLARLYLRDNPPDSPLMMRFGKNFPDFLSNLPQLAHLGYLGDVARLELALRRSYHAADSEAIDPATLGTMSPERLMDCRVTLAPAAYVLRSNWPIHDIWRFNTEQDAPKPVPVAQDVLITRPGFDPVPYALPPGAATWLAALWQGETIGAAYDLALDDHPRFDLSAPLALLLSGQALISLTPKD